MMNFQDMILVMQRFWADHDCIILQPYDMEVGAGTFHPATTLRSLDSKPWNAAYVQPCRRPTDGRYGENPNRLQHYYQFQVIMKPYPKDFQDMYLRSLEMIGIDTRNNDIRFVEDDWKSPTLGAHGVGWEVWCNGMEISQFTYFQQVAGINCDPIPGEITYGLERLAMYLQNVDNVFQIKYNDSVTYGEIFQQNEQEYSKYNFECANVDMLVDQFDAAVKECQSLLSNGLVLPAYDQCIKASHSFNLQDSRGSLSIVQREKCIETIRNLAKLCGQAYVKGE